MWWDIEEEELIRFGGIFDFRDEEGRVKDIWDFKSEE